MRGTPVCCRVGHGAPHTLRDRLPPGGGGQGGGRCPGSESRCQGVLSGAQIRARAGPCRGSSGHPKRTLDSQAEATVETPTAKSASTLAGEPRACIYSCNSNGVSYLFHVDSGSLALASSVAFLQSAPSWGYVCLPCPPGPPWVHVRACGSPSGPSGRIRLLCNMRDPVGEGRALPGGSGQPLEHRRSDGFAHGCTWIWHLLRQLRFPKCVLRCSGCPQGFPGRSEVRGSPAQEARGRGRPWEPAPVSARCPRLGPRPAEAAELHHNPGGARAGAAGGLQGRGDHRPARSLRSAPAPAATLCILLSVHSCIGTIENFICLNV